MFTLILPELLSTHPNLMVSFVVVVLSVTNDVQFALPQCGCRAIHWGVAYSLKPTLPVAEAIDSLSFFTEERQDSWVLSPPSWKGD